MQNVSAENGLFSANINKRGVCQCGNGASADHRQPFRLFPLKPLWSNMGTSFWFIFSLSAGGKAAGHFFSEKEGWFRKHWARCLCLPVVRLVYSILVYYQGFPDGSASKESACSAGDLRDVGSISGSGRSPGGGKWQPIQDSCLKNPMDRRA